MAAALETWFCEEVRGVIRFVWANMYPLLKSTPQLIDVRDIGVMMVFHVRNGAAGSNMMGYQ